MKNIIVVLSLLFTLNLSAQEDDNVSIELEERSGWFVSLSGGYAAQDIQYLNNKVSDRIDSYGSLATSFKAGLFLDKNLVVYFSNYTNFFNAPFLQNGVNQNSLYLEALNGIGASYYFKDGPSFYISGSVGGATFMSIGETNAEFGSAYLVSLGYEFENNFNIEVVLRKFAEFQSSDYDYLSIDTQSTQFLVGYKFY